MDIFDQVGIDCYLIDQNSGSDNKGELVSLSSMHRRPLVLVAKAAKGIRPTG